MEGTCRLDVLDRRSLVVGASAASLVIALLKGSLVSAQEVTGGSAIYEETLKSILGEAKPSQEKLTLELPEIAENGNTVPFTVAVESPMTESNYVKAIHVLSTANPVAAVATFHFAPIAGRAAAGSRLRLAKSQDVVAVAELSDGQFLLTKRNVKVTIGGCGG